MQRLKELVYDTLIFCGLMLLVLIVFIFVADWMIGRVKSAPAPLPKRQRVQWVDRDNQVIWFGIWKCKKWDIWRLSFEPNSKYVATLGTSCWIGTWKVEYQNEQYWVVIEEHPINDPTHILRYRYTSDEFERIYEVTD